MHSHLEAQTAFRAGLTTRDVPPGLTAVGDLSRRFSVYRNTVAHSLTEALAQRFPVVCRIVGPAFFGAMAHVFVAAHPPRSPILHDYGADFPDFLKTFPPVASLPYLPDVAWIEVLRGRAYHAADAVPLPNAAITARLAGDVEAACLSLHPAMRVMISPYPAVSIWTMNQPGAVIHPLQPRPESALIHRHGDDVIVQAVGKEVFTVITALLDGTPLSIACRGISPAGAAEAVSILMRHGLIVGLTSAQIKRDQ